MLLLALRQAGEGFGADRLRAAGDRGAHELLMELFRAGLDHGGAISGEHGIGTAKLSAYVALTDPVRLELERRIKAAFDPTTLLNPGRSMRGTPS